MKQARVFEFDRFEVSSEGDKVSFHYKIHFEDNSVQTFTEILSLPVKLSSVDEVTKQLAERILEDVHLILGISYFKLYCPKEILVNSAFLTQVFSSRGFSDFNYRVFFHCRFSIKMNTPSIAIRIKLTTTITTTIITMLVVSDFDDEVEEGSVMTTGAAGVVAITLLLVVPSSITTRI